jgi:hypothetical protein
MDRLLAEIPEVASWRLCFFCLHLRWLCFHSLLPPPAARMPYFLIPYPTRVVNGYDPFTSRKIRPRFSNKNEIGQLASVLRASSAFGCSHAPHEEVLCEAAEGIIEIVRTCLE